MRTLFIALLASSSVCAKPLEVKVIARSAILMNADTGAILYEKNSRDRSFPASVTKTATALYILDTQRLPLDRIVKVSHEALKMKSLDLSGAPHELIHDGTMMGLRKGEEVSVDALLHGLMLISGNDAANTLAEAHSGSIPKFVEELNDYLCNTIGCEHTQFCNPHGIHCDDHFTSAYDLCLIAKRGLQIPKFREIVSTLVYQCPKTNKRPALEIRQKNALLKKGRHYYPKAIGIKTGFYSHAMNTLVAAAEHEGRTLIAVLLGCPKSNDRYQDATALFEAAFKEKLEKLRIMGPERAFTKEILGAKNPLLAFLPKELEISYFPAEEPQCKAFVQWDVPPLPIKKGQKVGELHIFDQHGKKYPNGKSLSKRGSKGDFFFPAQRVAGKLVQIGIAE